MRSFTYNCNESTKFHRADWIVKVAKGEGLKSKSYLDFSEKVKLFFFNEKV